MRGRNDPYWRKSKRQRINEAAAWVRGWLAGLPPPLRIALVLVVAVLLGVAA